MTGILMVCEANICRSATAEFVFAEGIARIPGLEDISVMSRGVVALPEHGACRLAADLSTSDSWLARARMHRSHQLDAATVEQAQLILTADTSTRAAAVSLAPGARRNVFTLREALWLSADYRAQPALGGEDAVAALVAHLDAQRGLVPVPRSSGSLWRRPINPLDIPDGHLIGGRAHPNAIRLVERTVAGLISVLAGERPA